MAETDPEIYPYSDQEARTSFTYIPLCESQIRLLDISLNHDEGLNFRSRTVERSEARGYFALSYLWGALGEAQHEITIDGRCLSIQHSLRIALEGLRAR